MTYIIGEIGQNHNGSVDIARLIIDLAGSPVEEELFGLHLTPMNAIKLTKRDLKHELSKSQMDAPYGGKHSFGATYGEHRKALELNDEEHFEIYSYAKEKNLDVVETFCAIGCLSLLNLFQPDYLKVASRDLTNIPLLIAMAETKIPIILSTGMAGKKELDDALDAITKYHQQISILHCTSQYPTEPENVNLNAIRYLKKNYPKYRIGYSDHTVGIMAPIAAVALGAEMIEKHITIDRRMKGTDQEGSLGPDGLNRMVRDIRLLEKSFGSEDIQMNLKVMPAKIKLERSIATNKPIEKGSLIRDEDIQMLSPGDGYKWSQKDLIIGKIAAIDIPGNEIIYQKHITDVAKIDFN